MLIVKRIYVFKDDEDAQEAYLISQFNFIPFLKRIHRYSSDLLLQHLHHLMKHLDHLMKHSEQQTGKLLVISINYLNICIFVAEM